MKNETITYTVGLNKFGGAVIEGPAGVKVLEPGTIIEANRDIANNVRFLFQLPGGQSDVEIFDANNDVDSRALRLTAQADGSFIVSGPDIFPRNIQNGNVISVCGFPILVNTSALDRRNAKFAAAIGILERLEKSFLGDEFVVICPTATGDPPDLIREIRELTKVNISTDVFDAAEPAAKDPTDDLSDAEQAKLDAYIDAKLTERLGDWPAARVADDDRQADIIRGMNEALSATPPPIRKTAEGVEYWGEDPDRTPPDARRCDQCKRRFTGPAKLDAKFTFCGDQCQEDFAYGVEPAVWLRPTPIADADETKAINERRIADASDPARILGDGFPFCPVCEQPITPEYCYTLTGPEMEAKPTTFCSIRCVNTRADELFLADQSAI
jgi:hypothetical protein